MRPQLKFDFLLLYKEIECQLGVSLVQLRQTLEINEIPNVH